MGTEKKVKTRPNKIVAMVTYIIALVCLLLGLFLPADFADPMGSMLGLQIPAALGKIIPGLNIQGELPDFGYSFPFAVFGFPEGGIDLAAILVVLYALIAVIGVIVLIPVIASTVGGKKKKKGAAADDSAPAPEKEDKNVALGAASFVEVLAMIVLTTFFLLLLNQVTDIAALANYGLLAAFGGALLMLIVQALFYKGGSGLVKTLLAIFSALSVICLFGVSFVLPFLAETVSGLNLTLFTVGETPADALELINSMFTTGLNMEQELPYLLLDIFSVVLGYLVCVNLVVDIMGLGKKTNKFMLIANIVRYTLELAAVLTILIIVLVVQAGIGNLSILFAVIAALSLIINIIRLAAYSSKHGKKKAKKSEKAPVKSKKEKPAKTKTPAPEDRVKEEPVFADTPVTEGKEEPDSKLYSPVIYNGPTDDFIRTLPNDQKVEFSRIFLERQQGPITCIPDYNVGGRNEKFFASIFIYYSRIRDLVSDGLMNNLYKQANIM